MTSVDIHKDSAGIWTLTVRGEGYCIISGVPDEDVLRMLDEIVSRYVGESLINEQ